MRHITCVLTYLLSHVADVYSANRHAQVLCSKDTIDTKVMNYTDTSAHTHTHTQSLNLELETQWWKPLK